MENDHKPAPIVFEKRQDAGHMLYINGEEMAYQRALVLLTPDREMVVLDIQFQELKDLLKQIS